MYDDACLGDVRSSVCTLTLGVRLPLSFAEADTANKAEEADGGTLTMAEIQSVLYHMEPKPLVRFIHCLGFFLVVGGQAF